MRKAIFLLVTCLLTGSVYAQSQNKITLTLKNVSLEKVIDSIRTLAAPRYLISYNSETLQPYNNISVTIVNADVKTALEISFANLPLTYKMIGRRILIKENPEITVSGKVLDQDRNAVENATVTIKETGKTTVTDSNGIFRINNVNRESTLVISSISHKQNEVNVDGRKSINIYLVTNEVQLEQVTVSDGYQTKNKETAPGSFIKLDRVSLNRNTSFKILDRLEGVTSGYLPAASRVDGSNQPQRTIRGISTINAYSEPLVIVDNFPYDGNLDNINPNDVESITIARDAAAASIWGAFAGNGVIVITTKKGKYDSSLKITVNSIITAGGKPDLYYTPILDSRSYVEVEEFLFNHGHYDDALNSPEYTAVSPVVEILDKKRKGLITDAIAQQQLETLRLHDTRTDRQKYFFRNIFNQQYAISLTGGSKNIRNYLSIGFDQNMGNLKRNKTDRLTITGNNSYRLLKDKLELSTGIVFTHNTIDLNNIGVYDPFYPYLTLVDANGNSLPVAKRFRPGYTDTAGAGKLLNWKYNPVDEMNASDNHANRTHYRVSLGLDYKLLKTVRLLVNYQYTNEIYELDDIKDTATYYTRDLINSYTQIDFQTGQVTRPIPVGSVYDRTRLTTTAHNVRAQGKWNTVWKENNELNFLGGIETRIVETQANTNRLYGYNKSTQLSQDVNYQIEYPLYNNLFTAKIPDNVLNLGTTDHYFSIFANAAYTYKQRYTFSASARKDQSNLFGVNTNRKGVPLWSVGASWEITKDADIRFLDQLRLRATHGYTGNIDKTVSAYTTAKVGDFPTRFNSIPAAITNPPNKDLTWEKVSMTNFAIDFAFPKNNLTGSIEYYFKKGSNLIGYTEVDPTTGFSIFRGNSAGIKASGFDIILNAKIIDRKFGWRATLLLSHVKDKVTSYTGGAKTIKFYADAPFFNPLPGKPLYSVYSYPFAGLNATGDPIGFINGHDTTTNYQDIFSSTNFNDLIYNGPATPTTFGSIRNTFSFKNFELSVNILFKSGYYFMRSSIDYFDTYRSSYGHPDYTKRWQVVGDENKTNVPSMIYPPNIDRDAFYNRASILVEKGDHIRLQDALLSYTANNFKIGSLKMPARFSLYANNIGILWKATKTHYDPDFVLLKSIPNPTTISAGLTLNF